MAAIIARHLPPSQVIAGIGVGVAGTVLRAVPILGDGPSSVVGMVMILTALVSYGVALNIARPLQQRNGALPVVWRAQMVALLLTAPMGLSNLIVAQWKIVSVAALRALGALGTGVAYAVMAIAAGRLGATRASSTTFLIPAVALVLGVVVYGEKVALLSVIGSVVSVGGALLIRRTPKLPHAEASTSLLLQQPVLSVIKLAQTTLNSEATGLSTGANSQSAQ